MKFKLRLPWAVVADGGPVATVEKATTLNSVSSQGGWISLIREGFSGAWQQVTSILAPKDILAYSAVYACVTLIASDIGKLRIKLMAETDGIGVEIRAKDRSPFLKILSNPNRFQTRMEFIVQWIVSKLLWGNTYVLKEYNGQGIVVAMYILDPARVTVLVAEDGGVYYRLATDDLAQVRESVVVPASDIIHDKMVTLWHPLVGVSPIYACGMSATQGTKIQSNSTKFFENMSRPSGLLIAPNEISNETAIEMKKMWEENFKGDNLGKIAVLGDGLTYQSMAIPAQESQLIDQQKWTVEDVARTFHVPLFKLGGAIPNSATVAILNNTYYTDCLQAMIEGIELRLDEGLRLGSVTETDRYYTEFDTEGLLRMDQAARFDSYAKGVNGGWMDPNEARRREGLPKVTGGDTPYLQQQNYSLAALAKRDSKDDPFEKATDSTQKTPDQSSAANDSNISEDDTADAVAAASLAEYVQRGLVYERV